LHYFINDSTPDEPFLLYVPFNAPHSPLQADPEVLATYAGEGEEPTKRQIYSAMVTSLDTAIGRILDALDRKGVANDTLVLFFSDNGGHRESGASNLPLRGAKFMVYEGGVRAPAVIRWPERLAGGRKLDTLTGYVDVLPTALAATGINVTTHKALDGVNMLPVLAESEKPAQRTFYLGQSRTASSNLVPTGKMGCR